MITSIFFAAAVSASAASSELTFTADRIAADRVTGAAVATGNVVAVRSPYSLRSEYLAKDADGTYRFSNPTYVTTCTNKPGHTHWNITGELVYKDGDRLEVKDVWLRFYEIPVFWIPWGYYPLGTDCGFSWMPGYRSRWGAFLLTKYRYHLLGDETYSEGGSWLKAATRFDMRYKNGLAVGEDLGWGLGDFGAGSFTAYFADDKDAEDRYGFNGYAGAYNHMGFWGSDVKRERYIFTLTHDWEPTERDVVRIRGTYLSDSYFNLDFRQQSFFSLRDQWLSYNNSGVFWEHLEDSFSFGVETSGRLNDFIGMTGRLPEMYFDVNPLPLGSSPFIYESQNRIGYLTRDFAEYSAGRYSLYGTNPGPWADYSAFRADTRHAVSAPVRTLDDLLSVVPRLAWRTTYWDHTGETEYTGRKSVVEQGYSYRSIAEAGATFAARGTADIDEKWVHIVEPYLDVLGQEAWYGGLGRDCRPYVFDSLDASLAWEDQFAGRSRALPYSYYGITPGLRNAWSARDEKGTVRKVVDLDVYAAAQFNKASYTEGGDLRRLAEPGYPNYGRNGSMFAPGARLRWTPDEDTMAGIRGEYNSDDNELAYVSAFFRQKFSKDLSVRAAYDMRKHRYWDYSSTPLEYNGFAHFHIIDVGMEHTVCDWLAWGPMLRWDLRENELDSVGAWIDYLTDCLGFRFSVEYDNSFRTMDGFEYDEDWSFGFYIYLRCFGPDSGDVFASR